MRFATCCWLTALLASSVALAQSTSSTETASTPAPASSTSTTAAASDSQSADQANGDDLQGLTSHDYVGVLGSFLFADHKRGADVHYGAGAAWLFGQHFDSGWGWEASFASDVFETGPNGGGDLYRYTLGADLVYSFGDRLHFTPFVLAGGGGDFNDAHPRSSNGASGYVDAGAGIVTAPFWHHRLRVRAEGRFLHDFLSTPSASGFNDYRISLGLEIPFYTYKHYALTTPQPVVKIVKVPTGLEDSDGDGVVDAKDLCPNTPPNTPVDGHGCPLKKVTRLDGVTFEFDKYRLRPDSKKVLDWVIEIMKKYPNMKVELAGYTDSIGTAAYNLKLSQRRADAVRQYLIEHGIAADRMVAKGYGKANPVATNSTPEGRELNRRVELHILNLDELKPAGDPPSAGA